MKKIIVLIMSMIAMSFAGTTYKDGSECKRDSIHKEYYESGAIKWETPYVNGKANGVQKRYYESGAIYDEIPYVNSKPHGIEKWYSKSGKLAGTSKFKNGILVDYKQCTDGLL